MMTESQRDAASQRFRQAMRDLVTAAARATDGVLLPGGLADIETALGNLEDLAVEVLLAADKIGDSDFEAGAAFDLLWPPQVTLKPGERAERTGPVPMSGDLEK